MRHLFVRSIMGLIAVLAFSSIGMAQAGAAANNTLYGALSADPSTGGPGGPAPRRDLSGVWTGPIVAKKGAVPPMTPLGNKLFSLNKSEGKFGEAASNDPWKTCDPFGFPRSAVDQIRALAFSQMPDKVVILVPYMRTWREVWMDGRELPKNIGHKGGPDSTWFGYSVGHWDGDYTLVIDTVGSDDRTWLDNDGDPHSVDAHVQERYTRVDHNHLEMTVTVDDPAIYTKSFVLGTSKFIWVPKQETEEQLCVPSEALTYLNTISIPVAGGAATNK
jgi:hypothetical protein